MTTVEMLNAIERAERNFAPGCDFARVLRNTRAAVAALIAERDALAARVAELARIRITSTWI